MCFTGWKSRVRMTLSNKQPFSLRIELINGMMWDAGTDKLPGLPLVVLAFKKQSWNSALALFWWGATAPCQTPFFDFYVSGTRPLPQTSPSKSSGHPLRLLGYRCGKVWLSASRLQRNRCGLKYAWKNNRFEKFCRQIFQKKMLLEDPQAPWGHQAVKEMLQSWSHNLEAVQFYNNCLKTR